MKDFVGRRFTRWVITGYSHQKGPHHYWKCKCDCGNSATVQQGSLGVRSFSCGCLRKEIAKEVNTTHGQSKTLLHGVWERMRQRCENTNASHYADYGGRGIKVCDKWQTFEGFSEDMGPGWEKGLTIERKNNDGNYEPSNCVWATMKTQARNRRNSALFDTKWGIITLAELAERTGINRHILNSEFKRVSKSTHPTNPRRN